MPNQPPPNLISQPHPQPSAPPAEPATEVPLPPPTIHHLQSPPQPNHPDQIPTPRPLLHLRHLRCIPVARPCMPRLLRPPNPLRRLIFFANVRHLLTPQFLPQDGFYGNSFLPVIVSARSKDIADAEILDIVRLIRDGKAILPDEFAKSARGEYTRDQFEFRFGYKTMFVLDWTQLRFLDVDYGWGKPVHVIPFAYYDFMPVAILGRPLGPKKGAWLMTQCVKKEHLLAFVGEMNSLA